MDWKETCIGCKKEFLINDKRQKYCNQKCYFKNKTSWNKNIYIKGERQKKNRII